MKKEIKPFLKWAGGKRQLLPEIRPYMPEQFGTYFEPFIGAGAVFFDIQPKKAVINDTNEELMNCYLVIRDHIEELIEMLFLHKEQDNEKYFYALRNLDRDPKKFKKLTNIERAARIIYLNKTCFNGLFRENSRGEFNTPYGKYKNPLIIDEESLRSIHTYLNENEITISNQDFKEAVMQAKKGDLIYFDPPYDPVSDTSYFTSYSKNGFNKENQKELYDLFETLHKKGCFVLLSNSSTNFILDLYKDYEIKIINANRKINANGNKRGKVKELLMLSFSTD